MSLTSDVVAAQQVQDRLKALHASISDVEKKKSACEQTIISLQRSDDKMPAAQKVKLIKTCLAQTDAERESIIKALQVIHEIRNIKNERRNQARTKEFIRKGTRMKILMASADTIPLFVGKFGEKAPPLCGAIPAEKHYVAKIGDMVAALVNVEDEITWILAEVVSYDAITAKYEVDDIMKEKNQKERHCLGKKCVIPLSLMRANPETNPEALFPANTLVMALFPQTTCFYRAVVTKPPIDHTEKYEVLFEDSNYPEGFSPPLYVPQRYIIPCKEESKGNWAPVPGTSKAVDMDMDIDSDSEDV